MFHGRLCVSYCHFSDRANSKPAYVAEAPLFVNYSAGLCEGDSPHVESVTSKQPRITVYNSLVLPVLLYGCDIWKIRKNDMSRLKQ